MHKITLLIFFFGLAFVPLTHGQSRRGIPQLTKSGKGKVNEKVDNIGYWQLMLQRGYVRPNPPKIFEKSIFTGSKISAPGILVQDSPDVPLTTDTTTTQSENSIFINPENDEELLNSNNATDWSNHQVNMLFGSDNLQSEDAGISWAGNLEGTGSLNSGDPTTAIGLNGWMYVGKINADLGQSVAYSTNHGLTWHDVLVATVPLPGSDVLDKEHLWIDNSTGSPFEGNLYEAWTSFIINSPDYEQIMVTRSEDHGLTWATPIDISSAVHALAQCQGANIQTGPQGELYCAFSIYDDAPLDEHAIGFAKSLNGGSIFTPATRIIDNIKGIRSTETSKDMRVNSFPIMTVDNSNGPRRGNIYLVWTNRGFPGINTGVDIDIYMIRSSDQGSTWSAPVKVNQDPSGLGKQHFFPWITCDPVTGILCVVFLDDRNVSSSQVETWIAYSYDGGDSWTDMKVSDVAYTPGPIPGLAIGYFGDYLGITSWNMMAYPVWTDNRTGTALTYISPVFLGPAPGQPFILYDSYDLASAKKKSGQNMNYGDSLLMTLSLKNIGDQPATGITAYLSTSSPYITITDSIAYYGDFSPGEVKPIPNGYTFKVSDTIPDGLKVKFTVRAVGTDTSWTSTFKIEAHAPGLQILKMVIHDSLAGNNNGHLDPGENDSVIATVANTGDFQCLHSWLKVSSPSDYLTFSDDSVYLDSLLPGQSKKAAFSLGVTPDACLNSTADLHFLAGSGLYRSRKTLYQTIGMNLEDWESDGFTKFPWVSGGTAIWKIDTAHHDGKYSARSGTLSDMEYSDLEINYNAGSDDSISFYRKISSELGYDFFTFTIDGVIMGQWSGENSWKRFVYPVSAGSHLFKWSYATDPFFEIGSNAAWLDDILFPPGPIPSVYAGPDTTICKGQSIVMHALASGYDSLHWSTTGDGVFSNDTILHPVYTPGSNDITAGHVRLRLKGTGPGGCYSSSMQLAFSDIPLAIITIFPDDTLCGGQVAHLFVDSVFGNTYFWSPGGYTTPDISADTSLTGGFGSFWFRATVTNPSLCSSKDSVKVTFKDCSGVEEIPRGFRYEVFPNPNTGTFTVTIHSPARELVNMQLKNSLGIILLEEKGSGGSGTFTKTFKLNHLSPGMYVLTLENHEGKHNIKVLIR